MYITILINPFFFFSFLNLRTTLVKCMYKCHKILSGFKSLNINKKCFKYIIVLIGHFTSQKHNKIMQLNNI